MSSHADTIRDYIKTSTPAWRTPIPFPAAEAWDAVAALLAENQRLRDALVEIRDIDLATIPSQGVDSKPHDKQASASTAYGRDFR